MKSRSTLTVVASLFAAALFTLPCAYADEAFEEDFPTAEVEIEVAASDLADLEKSFWICDYAATTYGVDMVDGDACGTVYEGLKRVKFGGDFDALVDWWSEHKATEHEALELAGIAHANAARDSAEVFPESI